MGISGTVIAGAVRPAGALALAAACWLGPVSAGARAATAAYVRVDQVGYQPSAPKRAYVLSRKPEAGVSFTVLDQGSNVVLSGSVGPALGRWSSRAGEVYPIDFGALTAPGTYTIEIAGKTPATSPPFEVAAAAQLYGAPLADALSFYENERDGPEYIPSALRSAPAHLNDEHAMTYATPKANAEGEFKGELPALGETIDASGGWWDAGDYLKFVQTTSYTVALQLAGVRDFPGQMGATAGCLGLHRRGPLRGRMAAEDVERQHPRRSTTRWGSARATAKPPATTTSGACPRPTTATAARVLSSATSANGRSSAPRLPAHPSAPTSPAATRRRSRSASRCSRPPAPNWPRAAYGPASTSSNWPTPTPRATC